MLVAAEILIGIFIALILLFFNAPFSLISITIAFFLLLPMMHGLTISLVVIDFLVISVLFLLNIPPLRRRFLTAKIFHKVKAKLPSISKTEQEVLAAGHVGWEQELFVGRPHWEKFLKFPMAKLSRVEEEFLNNQVDILCNMLQDWQVIQDADLPEQAWAYIKKERFLGLVIPKKYGGHEFSAFAHSTIVMKIASRSYSAAVNVMVPNSVGLAEFILQYGTQAQKSYYLPRFVAGEDIPCFALTSPQAGSDAGSMPDHGRVLWQEFQGEKTLGILLNWDKRYITLAPIATMIGLAFKLYDPDQLLGEQTDLGITLAMIPRNFSGVQIGTRHSPLLMAFLNGPVRGKDVFIPLNYLIGDTQNIGKGWAMMMECLAVGRGISIPALSVAGAKLSYRFTSAYVKVREQFHFSLGYFEGIKEALARIGGLTYLCEATRCLTASIIDQNIKPSIATAITKYHLTEMSRKIVNDAMDIHAGRGIQLGPNNYLGLYYIAQPIGITVEGANILTRNLILFGQGALRCHPYIRSEIAALQEKNFDKALKKFDKLFFKHIGYVFSNVLRSLCLGLTHARWVCVPTKDFTAQYYRQLTRMSVALALVTDMAMGVLGGKLKQRERLSARLGDVLSFLYLGSAVLKYYEEQKKPGSDLPFVDWSLKYCLYQINNAFDHFFANFPQRFLARIVKNIIFPWGISYVLPLDNLDHKVAEVMMQDQALRKRLTDHIALGSEQEICQKMDLALECCLNAQVAYQKLQQALGSGQIKEKIMSEQILAAKGANILSGEEAEQLLQFDRLQQEVIQVDEFAAIPIEKN